MDVQIVRHLRVHGRKLVPSERSVTRVSGRSAMINRDSWGHSYLTVRGEIIGLFPDSFHEVPIRVGGPTMQRWRSWLPLLRSPPALVMSIPFLAIPTWIMSKGTPMRKAPRGHIILDIS